MNFTEYWLALDTTRVPLRATRPHNMCLYRPYILFIGCNRAYFAFKGCNRNYFAYNTKQGTSISLVMYCLHPGLLLWITCLQITYKYRPCILYIGCNMAYCSYKTSQVLFCLLRSKIHQGTTKSLASVQIWLDLEFKFKFQVNTS